MGLESEIQCDEIPAGGRVRHHLASSSGRRPAGKGRFWIEAVVGVPVPGKEIAPGDSVKCLYRQRAPASRRAEHVRLP